MEIAQLPVYNKTRRLVNQVLSSSHKATKNLKIALVDKIEANLISVLENIAFANKSVDNTEKRIDFIDAAIKIMEKVEVRVRILYDLGGIKKSGLTSIIFLEDDVMRQLIGWKNSSIMIENN